MTQQQKSVKKKVKAGARSAGDFAPIFDGFYGHPPRASDCAAGALRALQQTQVRRSHRCDTCIVRAATDQHRASPSRADNFLLFRFFPFVLFSCSISDTPIHHTYNAGTVQRKKFTRESRSFLMSLSAARGNLVCRVAHARSRPLSGNQEARARLGELPDIYQGHPCHSPKLRTTLSSFLVTILQAAALYKVLRTQNVDATQIRHENYCEELRRREADSNTRK